MSTRFRFGPEFMRAVQVRGLTLTDVARSAGVALATACSAAHGDAVNVSTAIRLSKAVAAVPVLPELEAWVSQPDTQTFTDRRDPDGPSRHVQSTQTQERRRPHDDRRHATAAKFRHLGGQSQTG